jgi:hypothetical protein
LGVAAGTGTAGGGTGRPPGTTSTGDGDAHPPMNTGGCTGMREPFGLRTAGTGNAIGAGVAHRPNADGVTRGAFAKALELTRLHAAAGIAPNAPIGWTCGVPSPPVHTM